MESIELWRKEMTDNYVYVYLDPRKSGHYVYGEYVFDYEPFYVGRGIENRYKMHLYRAKQKVGKGLVTKRTINRIRGLLHEGLEPIIQFLHKNVSYDESISLEISAISLIGREQLSKGPLLNRTDGGEGCNGYIITDEVRQRIREKVSGELSPVKGRKRTPEEIKRISEKQKGKFVSEETRQRLRASHKEQGTIDKSMRRKIQSVFDILITKGLPFDKSNYRKHKRDTDPSFDNVFKYYSLQEVEQLFPTV